MATLSKDWTAQTWIEATASTWTTLSGTTEEFSSSVDMVTNGYEGAHIQPEVDFDATPTDNVIISLYGSLDGTNWDDTPISEIEVDRNTDPNQISFMMEGLAYWRLGSKQTGSTDSHNVRASYRAWRYQSA